MFTNNKFAKMDSIANLVKTILEADTKAKMEELKGNQHKIDKNKNNKIDAHDFAILRGQKKGMKEESEQVDEASSPAFQSSYGLNRKTDAATKKITPVSGKKVQGKGYDRPENERKSPEGHVPVTSLMPGHDERAAKFLARQAQGTGKLVRGKAQSATQKEDYDLEDYDLINRQGVAEGFSDVVKGVKRTLKGKEHPDVVAARHAGKAIGHYNQGDMKAGDKESQRYVKTRDMHLKAKGVAEGLSKQARAKNEEVEQLDEIGDTPAGREKLLAVKRRARDAWHADLDKSTAATGRPDHYTPTAMKADKTVNKVNDRLSGNRSKRLAMKGKTQNPDNTRYALGGRDTKSARSYSEEVEQVDERTLSGSETAEKERIVKGMKKSLAGFKARYGDRAKNVMYATATKKAKETK